MYKFTNGIVVFDEKTRDRYINAGYKLVEKEKMEEISVENSESEEKENNENTSNNGTIERKPKKCNKFSK